MDQQGSKLRLVPLTDGENFAIIDAEDFDFVSRFNWNYVTGYAQCLSLNTYMHVLIMKIPAPPLVVRHLDDIGLHNFKSNLKVSTQSENISYATQGRPNKHGLPRGVAFRHGKYQVAIRVNRVYHYLGSFKTPEEASAVYEAKRKELFGGSTGL